MYLISLFHTVKCCQFFFKCLPHYAHDIYSIFTKKACKTSYYHILYVLFAFCPTMIPGPVVFAFGQSKVMYWFIIYMKV